MRAIIATDFGSLLRKLIWVSEIDTGVSAGICDASADPHATYHVDGTYHHKIRSKGRIVTLASETKRPLIAIRTQEQLLGTAAFYADKSMKKLPPFTPDRRVDALLVLGQSVFRDIGCATFNISLIHRSHEARFIDDAYSSYEDGCFMLVAVNIFNFQRFSDHKVGVVIYKGRKAS